ncbi:pseudouridine synthase [Ferruginibacter sp.]|uniref:pseudouridine synthase n=1 Tax=Ferruginibacter sp. TaxID=1940288 RepID=UPI00265B09C2|nr:pseudouridine synthase [Ferruginibacter sp.]
MSGFIIFTRYSATFILLLIVSFYSSIIYFLLEYYCIIYKPFNVLSQFTSGDGKQTLRDFFDVPGDVYPAGRLDYDSEGLLVLTNDKKLNHQLLNPSFAHEREYWVQVEGEINDEAINDLQNGVDITVDGKIYRTKNCKAMLFKIAPVVPDRNPPIRYRKNIPTSWIKLIITEGKNRQVRKMTAAVGFPTLRLIRYRIEKCSIDLLQPGEMRILTSGEAYHFLFSNRNAPHKVNK